jgi:hypothetical protein
MSQSIGVTSFNNAALAAELDRLGIAWVVASVDDRPEAPPEPIELIAALSSSDEARLRMALIPLFLARPDYAELAGETAAMLAGQPRVTLICYYTAAELLQRKYEDPLEKLGLDSPILKDWFSQELGLRDAGDPDALLAHLANRHAELSGRQLNWYGTYEQAARRFMQRLEQERTWIKR